jgi:hypothetical protein
MCSPWSQHVETSKKCENACCHFRGVGRCWSEHEVIKPVAHDVLRHGNGPNAETAYNSLKSAKTAKTRFPQRAFWERYLPDHENDMRTFRGVPVTHGRIYVNHRETYVKGTVLMVLTIWGTPLGVLWGVLWGVSGTPWRAFWGSSGGSGHTCVHCSRDATCTQRHRSGG